MEMNPAKSSPTTAPAVFHPYRVPTLARTASAVGLAPPEPDKSSSQNRTRTGSVAPRSTVGGRSSGAANAIRQTGESGPSEPAAASAGSQRMPQVAARAASPAPASRPAYTRSQSPHPPPKRPAPAAPNARPPM